MLVEGREKRQVKRLFSRYLSKDVYEEVLKNPSLAELGGSRRTMSVLFSDMRGFTALDRARSAGSDRRAVERVLHADGRNRVRTPRHARQVRGRHGDGAVRRAAGRRVARGSRGADGAGDDQGLNELNKKWAAEGRPTLGIGIGVNTGEMIAGTIGAETVRSYTVIGDAVNLGARLESLNKEYGTQIIISEFTVNSLKDKTRYTLRPLGQVSRQGQERARGDFRSAGHKPRARQRDRAS